MSERPDYEIDEQPEQARRGGRPQLNFVDRLRQTIECDRNDK